MEKVKFACWNCGKKYTVDVEHAGRKARCIECKTKITIPSCQDTLSDSLAQMILDMEDPENEELLEKAKQETKDSDELHIKE